MIRIQEIKIKVNDIDINDEQTYLKRYVERKYRIKPSDIITCRIQRKAIDARKKDQVFYVYAVDLVLANEAYLLNRGYPNINEVEPNNYDVNPTGTKPLNHRPVIIGFGPSGIFASLLLARKGYKPIVLERGLDVDQRTKYVEAFWRDGIYHEKATILFGEGGAGTFSDGKLTTLINDLRCGYVLDAFYQHGAKESILYDAKPHVGTDVLKGIIKSIRKEIITLGGEVRFESNVTNFILKDNQLIGLEVNNQEIIPTNVCLMGVGHSARQTFTNLYELGLDIKQKAFSIGLRIEHPQDLINQSQYKTFASYLPPAEYKLSYKNESGRGAYTFCMCPGGYVMCATSEAGGVVTNGMSESKRDGQNANSALLVNVMPSDFNSDHPLAGMYFQRQIEEKAFEAAGNNYYAPIQKVKDFLMDKKTTQIGQVIPTYTPGYTFVKLSDILPKFINDTLKKAILDFDKKLKGFAMDDAILTGVETRSSSPIRMQRNGDGESNIKGLYPMGEGAGYAGGIMSSAVDGLRQAESILNTYKKPID